MSGCIDCFSSTKGREQVDYSKVVDKAKEHAKKTGKPVAIYEEAGEWCYIDAQTAFQNGYPVKEVVSAHQ